MFRILVVEDDKAISRLLELELTHVGYNVKIAKDGDEALKFYENFKPDIILLDIMLPIRDGFEVAEAIRDYDSDIGIIMITAKGELESKVKGLKNADDYVVKPFEIEEILARIEALLKRMGKTKELIKVGDIEIYPQNMEVLVNKKNVHLSLTEFNILKLLAINKNIVVSKEKILEEIWGYYDEENNNLVEVYINYLRKKLKDSTQNIETVRGVGYVIREKESKT
ncbi:response regulator ArlR [Petrotoga miotherma DSM 10691]|uniref:Two component transcriptional regulator, winged helix family n=4 Tax=Petrotoga TaxID=28236 RepID=A9BEW6_PETMO|nr:MULTISPECIES: response regulator transcription factor [Petrotoga]KUK15935.1 MAG: Two component transcriptional regulator, winged helix family [Petrotoga mobilis]HBT50954.1 DNA-binding response regulator [Petrotoga sp.]ABX30844.1 two component transcriptional regulator, winged helix family [Petrotoga mobilis SJ95]PNR89304.1 response regulator ArlR [Petrotoga sp. 9T1HF07.CasAA.8.2]PNR92603.1 response regulator ArlR [Petrotoga sp. HWHPT.55.6.3]